MSDWVRLRRFNDWGTLYFAEEGKGLGPAGTSCVWKYGLLFKDGDRVRVRWPDGSIDIEPVSLRCFHGKVHDMGHVYDVSYELAGVEWRSRGIVNWTPLDELEVDRKYLPRGGEETK